MTEMNQTRRHVLGLGVAAGALALPLAACSGEDGKEKEVGAVEDLMREHGVLRRALLVYAETAPLIRANPAAVDASALNKCAKLFQDFGEDYHERKLEEAYIFPRVKEAGGTAAPLCDVLLAQHNRGREITRYILGVTAGGGIGSANGAPLAAALESFVRMYDNHAAREDTIVFPAWKAALSDHELHELGERFEGIETEQFGGDGFDKAVEQMAGIEEALGFGELSQFTAPPPPQMP